MHLGSRHPPDNLVQVAPGEFYTVREVEENGWCLPARVPAKIPAVPDHPASPGTQTGPVSSLKSVRSSLKRPAPSSPVQHVNKRVATSQTSTGTVPLDGPNQVYSPLNPSIGFSTSLASTSNGAVTKMTNISEVAQCPNFWAMPVHALYEWRRHVNILDRTILGYYEQALDEAEKDLDRAASEPDVLDTSIVTPSGRPSAPRSGRKRSVKDETPAPGGSGPAFKFLKARPDRLDLLFMRALEALSPFGSNGQKGKVFHECAIWLKTDLETHREFAELSESPHSRVLQFRYTQLKLWLAAAESWSKMDSGTEEEDEELRNLIRSVQDEEEAGRSLKLACKEEREAVKGRSLLAEAVREEFATKAVQNLRASVSDGDEGHTTPSASRKAKRLSPSNANASTDELTAFTGELSRWNEVSLAAQAEQNTRINDLYERELVIAPERNENDRLIAQSLADHRSAELALQKQRLDFDLGQVNSSKNSLDTLQSKSAQ
ncbi:uncharacterized protein MELLADRAFT_90611 [Melampsora larici-populina 98AG31]|uniref:Uncharacterized protein n=1 Tax=Melampsora larici-populina (strain 98AG31 / pathotype 3-4-7) TaxID=747676 RepID=F4RXI6_MELLP|nr:uncharacterized protein MELLADRAFT_90611 [Melampsora larici-populina 98AG31]EGG02978.1 hypothetical protein MELLADRAFT_90611 [Melampsora larici-populina 98AG31]